MLKYLCSGALDIIHSSLPFSMGHTDGRASVWMTGEHGCQEARTAGVTSGRLPQREEINCFFLRGGYLFICIFLAVTSISYEFIQMCNLVLNDKMSC